jgi:predicted transcriptional regulator
MPTNAIEPALAAKIVELHKAGKPQDEIARELNLNEITVAKYRRAAGLAAHQPGAIAPEVAEQIAARLKRHQSKSRIVAELQVSDYQVRKVARGI